MDNYEQNQGMMPPQVPSSQYFDGRIMKPTSVTVFGVLNCVFGGLGIVCTPFSLLGLFIGDILPMGQATMEMTPMYKAILVGSCVFGIAFSAWLLTLGIGLLKFKRWARRGSVVYAVIAITWSIAGFALNMVALKMGWIIIPEGGLPGYIGGMCGGMVSVIYPILLLIFMSSARVKNAFAVIGG
jgi:hypothetical protein